MSFRCEDVIGYSVRVIRVHEGSRVVASISVRGDGALMAPPQIGPDVLDAVAAHLLANPERPR